MYGVEERRNGGTGLGGKDGFLKGWTLTGIAY